jgi:rhomboid family GlyGly-CTERM serine protease
MIVLRRARIITKWILALSDSDSAPGSQPANASHGSTLAGNYWLLGLLLALLVAVAALVSDPILGTSGQLALRYQRDSVLAGEYYRLLTGHFVHGSFQHWALNLGGLMLIAALFPRDYTWKQWLWVLVSSIVLIDIGFVFYQPQLMWYVGFSGVLHGALAAGAIAWWRSESTLLASALSVILIAKLSWEQWHGALPLSGDLPVVVDAHLYGAIGGAIAGGILWAVRQPWCAPPRSL